MFYAKLVYILILRYADVRTIKINQYRQLEERSKSKLQQQELALDAELGGIQFAAPRSSPFLGILDSDIQVCLYALLD